MPVAGVPRQAAMVGINPDDLTTAADVDLTHRIDPPAAAAEPIVSRLAAIMRGSGLIVGQVVGVGPFAGVIGPGTDRGDRLGRARPRRRRPLHWRPACARRSLAVR